MSAGHIVLPEAAVDLGFAGQASAMSSLSPRVNRFLGSFFAKSSSPTTPRLAMDELPSILSASSASTSFSTGTT